MISESTEALEIFYSYAHGDKALRDELEKFLATLKRTRLITEWYDRDIQAGMEWEREINTHLNTAHIILLLISPDFMNSDYCYSIEMQRAIERHRSGEARLIPIVLRPVDLDGTPISEFQMLPYEGKPVTKWRNRDDAFLDIAKGIRKVIKELHLGSSVHPPPSAFGNKHQRLGEESVQIPAKNEGIPERAFSQNRQQDMAQLSNVNQRLKALADQIEASDWRSATQLRSLSEALGSSFSSDNWIASDVYETIDPDLIIERFKNRPLKRSRVIEILKIFRIILIFGLPIFLLTSIFIDITDYQRLLQLNPDQIRASFLILWQLGFEGQTFLTPNVLLLLITLLIAIILMVTLLLSVISRHESTRREGEAEKLRENTINALTEVLLYLRSRP